MTLLPEEVLVKIISFDQVEGIVDTVDNTIFFTIPSHKVTSFTPKVEYYGYSSMRMDQSELIRG